jgi:hypothetical protein
MVNDLRKQRTALLARPPGTALPTGCAEPAPPLPFAGRARRGAAGRPSDDPHELRFAVHVRDDNRERTPLLVRLKALCGLGDQGEPVITILMPDED